MYSKYSCRFKKGLNAKQDAIKIASLHAPCIPFLKYIFTYSDEKKLMLLTHMFFWSLPLMLKKVLKSFEIISNGLTVVVILICYVCKLS